MPWRRWISADIPEPRQAVHGGLQHAGRHRAQGYIYTLMDGNYSSNKYRQFFMSTTSSGCLHGVISIWLAAHLHDAQAECLVFLSQVPDILLFAYLADFFIGFQFQMKLPSCGVVQPAALDWHRAICNIL